MNEKSTHYVMGRTGMSKSRCLQFARSYGLPKFGQMYQWGEKAIEEFEKRIGQRGKRAEKRLPEIK